VLSASPTKKELASGGPLSVMRQKVGKERTRVALPLWTPRARKLAAARTELAQGRGMGTVGDKNSLDFYIKAVFW